MIIFREVENMFRTLNRHTLDGNDDEDEKK